MLKKILSPYESSVFLAMGHWQIKQFVDAFVGEGPVLITEDGSVYEFSVFRRRSEVYGQWDLGRMTPEKRLSPEDITWLRDTEFEVIDDTKRQRIRAMLG